MASPAFWNIYLDPLLTKLREMGVGCHVGGLFVGVVGYADDLILLAPSRHAAQVMLKTCELFCAENNSSALMWTQVRAKARQSMPWGQGELG